MVWEGYDGKGDIDELSEEEEFNYPGLNYLRHRLKEAVEALDLLRDIVNWVSVEFDL